MRVKRERSRREWLPAVYVRVRKVTAPGTRGVPEAGTLMENGALQKFRSLGSNGGANT